MTLILVGVDGSPHSMRALRRGIEEAALRNGEVKAVYVIPPARRSLLDGMASMPTGITTPLGVEEISTDDPAHHPPSRDEVAIDEAGLQLKQIVAEVVSQTEGPEPTMVVIADEHPAEALIHESSNADLLVIGTRGFGGFRGMLLGSVAHQCIQNSRCPLLILPPEE